MDGAKPVPTVIRKTKENLESVTLLDISSLSKCFIRDVNPLLTKCSKKDSWKIF